MARLPGVQGNYAPPALCDPLTSKAWVGSGGGDGFLFMVTSSRIPSLWDTTGGVPDIPIHCTVSSHIHTHTHTFAVQLNTQRSPPVSPSPPPCVSVTLTLSTYKQQTEHACTLALPERRTVHPCRHVSLPRHWSDNICLSTGASECDKLKS